MIRAEDLLGLRAERQLKSIDLCWEVYSLTWLISKKIHKNRKYASFMFFENQHVYLKYFFLLPKNVF